MSIDLTKLSSTTIRRIEKETGVVLVIPTVSSKDEEVIALSEAIKALGKIKDVPTRLVVEAICKRLRVGITIGKEEPEEPEVVAPDTKKPVVKKPAVKKTAPAK